MEELPYQRNPQTSKNMATQTQSGHSEDLATKKKLQLPKDITTQTETEPRDVLTDRNKQQYSKDMATQTEKSKLEKEELREPDQRDFIVLQTDKRKEFKDHLESLEKSDVFGAASENKESIFLQEMCRRPIKIDNLNQHLRHTFLRFCKDQVFACIESYHKGQALQDSFQSRMNSLLEAPLEDPKLDRAHYTEALRNITAQKTPALAENEIRQVLSKGTSMEILYLIYAAKAACSSEETAQANQ